LPATITLELVCGVALIVGWQLRWVIPVLGLFCLGTAVVAHDFWNAGAVQYDGQLNNFLKNVAIAGGLLNLALASKVKERVASLGI
jgi:putative oxidoreductase